MDERVRVSLVSAEQQSQHEMSTSTFDHELRLRKICLRRFHSAIHQPTWLFVRDQTFVYATGESLRGPEQHAQDILVFQQFWANTETESLIHK